MLIALTPNKQNKQVFQKNEEWQEAIKNSTKHNSLKASLTSKSSDRLFISKIKKEWKVFRQQMNRMNALNVLIVETNFALHTITSDSHQNM